jgi:hypothetical protein
MDQNSISTKLTKGIRIGQKVDVMLGMSDISGLVVEDFDISSKGEVIVVVRPDKENDPNFFMSMNINYIFPYGHFERNRIISYIDKIIPLIENILTALDPDRGIVPDEKEGLHWGGYMDHIKVDLKRLRRDISTESF